MERSANGSKEWFDRGPLKKEAGPPIHSMVSWNRSSSTLPVPRVGAFALGMVKTGPIPQIRGPGCVGEKNNSSVTSPMPLVLLSNSGLGWLINGAMMHEIRFQSWLNVEYFLGAIERPSVEIGVALERHADEVRDRVL